MLVTCQGKLRTIWALFCLVLFVVQAAEEDVETGPAFTVTETPEEPEYGKPTVVLYSSFDIEGFGHAAKRNRQMASWYFVRIEGKRPEVSHSEVGEDGIGELDSVPGGVVPKVVITHKGEEPISLDIASAEIAEQQVHNFANYHSLPLFGKLDSDTFEKYKAKDKGLVWTLFDGDGDDVLRDQGAMMREVAKKFKKKYAVTYADTDSFKDSLEKMFGPLEFPAIIVQKKAGGKVRFKHTGDMTEKAITQFIEDIEAGNGKLDIKSQPVPESNDDPVRVVVASSFMDEVFSKSKDVLLEVYAPWCGHCQKVESEYLKVAQSSKKYGLEDLVTIAKIDGSANDSPVESMDFSAFPTIYYVKAGSSEPQVYDGERTSKAMWKFVKDNHSNAKLLKERIENFKQDGKGEL